MMFAKKSSWHLGAGNSTSQRSEPISLVLIVNTCFSLSVTDAIIDAGVLLTPFDSPGVVAPTGTLIHAGFLNAYVSGYH